MNISIRIKKTILCTLMGGLLLPVAQLYSNPSQPSISAGLATKMEQVETEIREKQPQTEDELAPLVEKFLNSLTAEEHEEFKQLQQAQPEPQVSQLSSALQAKIEALSKEIFKDIDLQTITPEQYTELEEKILSQLTAEERQELETVTKTSQAINHKILSKVLEQLDGVTRISQFLADAMNSEQVKPINPKKVLEYVREIAVLSHQIKEQFSSDNQATLDVIIKLINLCNYLGNHLQYSIATNLNDIKPLVIEKVLQRSKNSTIHSPEDLEKAFEANDKLLEELSTQAQSIGLAWYQKGFRKLEELDTKYNLRWNALKLSMVSAIAAITLHKLSDKSIQSIPGIKWTGIDWIKEHIVGEKFEYNKITGELVEGNHKPFGTIYDGITSRLGFFGDALQPALTLGSLYTFLIPDAAKWYSWSQEKLSNLATKLRGARAKYVFGGRREPKLTFDDQIGQDHIKQQMSRYISYLLDNQAYDHRGIGITCNVLFAGKTRTGKTFMAEAFVGELNRQLKAHGKDPVQFLIFSKLDIEKFGFKYILEYARDNAPCVVFIDEIDMLGLQPDQNGALLQEFLTALSGAMESKLSGVCFLAATNRPESLYKSLIRRFDKTIWFDYPPYEDRKIAFAQDLANHAIVTSPEFIDRIAKESEGCSFEDLHKIIVYASQRAETERRAINETDLQTAVDSVIWKIEQKPCSAPQTQKQIMAAHLAGEALARLLIPCHYELAKVTLRDVIKEITEMPTYMRYYKEASDEPHEIGKVLTYNPYHGKQINNAEQVHNECKTTLAGHIAEKILLGQSSHIYHQEDSSRALGMATFLLLEGTELDQLPKDVKNQKIMASYELVENYKREVQTLLENHKSILHAIAQELMKCETLNRAEVESIIEQTKTQEQIQSNANSSRAQ